MKTRLKPMRLLLKAEVTGSGVKEPAEVGLHITLAKGCTVDDAITEIERYVLETRKTETFPLSITMPCGKEYLIPTRNAFPTTDIRCTCGNPNHFFIKIDREE